MTGVVHLVGIGGAGMSGIARLLLARGAAVSGCDSADSAVLAGLRELGARTWVGHDPAHLAGVGSLVVNSAIRGDNAEVAAARELGIPVRHRAEALAGLMAGYRGVAVSGTHGKTSTSSMLAVAAASCGADPTYVIGGDLTAGGGNAHQGSGELFVVEADESDESFLGYHPFGAVVLNVEPDHLDHYGDGARYAAAFERFAATVRPGGFLVTCTDDPGAAALAVAAERADLLGLRYGTSAGADLRITELAPAADGVSYRPVWQGEELAEVRLRVPGAHMALNSAAALLAGLALGLPAAALVAGLGEFSGVRRRMELKGTAAGVRVFDDYAHHPTEVRAQLVAARSSAGLGRLVVAFQPHLFSRTREFAAEFGAALALADEVVVMDVYPSREDPLPGVTGELVARQVPLDQAAIAYQPVWDEVPAELARRVRPGDLVLTMGAGDVTRIGPELLRLLSAGAGER